MMCLSCGAKGLLASDVAGEKCVHCFGTEPKKKGYWECDRCGKTAKSLTNELCSECFELVFK